MKDSLVLAWVAKMSNFEVEVFLEGDVKVVVDQNNVLQIIREQSQILRIKNMKMWTKI